MTAVSSRQGTYASILAGLVTVQTEVASAWETLTGEHLETVGFRAQQAHVPPASWVDMQAGSVVTESGGRIRDYLPFELWFALAPSDSEDDELTRLAALVDVAVPIVDVATSRADARANFGVEIVDRTGFSFRSALEATTAGNPGDLPCLVIPLTAQWAAMVC